MKRILITTIAMLSALGCSRHEEATPDPTAVETAEVRPYAGANGIRYSATVSPDTEVAVAFRVSGYVDAVNVEEGTRVSKGTVLARVRRNEYQEKLGQASGSQFEAEASLALAKKNLDRATALFASNSLTKPDLDSAQANYDAAKARVDAGRAAAGQAGLILGDTTLVSPMNGIILKKNIERGDLAAPGSVAFTVGDIRTVKVEFGVPDTMIKAIKVGQPIDVTTESIPDRMFRGRVERVSTAADPKSRAFNVELHIDNPESALKPGMVAALELNRGAEKPSLAIPLAAVIRPPKSSDGYAVYVVQQDVVRAQMVDLGDPIGNLVMVKSGLKPGDRVVTSGPSLLIDGQAVRTVTAQ